jgi:hypothetical protein
MASIVELISRLGGPGPVSEHTGLARRTVNAWGERGSIPVQYWPELLLIAHRFGVPLVVEDLVETCSAVDPGTRGRLALDILADAGKWRAGPAKGA